MGAVCLYVRHSNPTYTFTLSLLFFPVLPLSLLLCLSLSSIFSCLLLHYHTNTLAHSLGKKKKRIGGVWGGEMHELSFNKGER